MKKIITNILVLLVLPALLVSFNVSRSRVDLSGDWKLNEGKSSLGDFGGRFAARSIKIGQREDAIMISKTAPGFGGGETTTTETLSFDGKESVTPGFGNSEKKSTAKWSEDGQSLIVNYSMVFERNGQTTEIKGTETWSIKDGQLSLHTVSSSPRGETTTTAIYDK